MIISDINKIELNRQNYEEINDIVLSYQDLLKKYIIIKKELILKKEMQNNQNKNIFSIAKKENINKSEISELEQKVKLMKENKDKLYLKIRTIVNKMISENNEYIKIYGCYLDYISFNEEVYTNYKYNLKLIEEKGRIDKFFNKLKEIIETNKKIDNEEYNKLKKQYKNVIYFLKKVYENKENKNKILKMESFEFSNELDIKDAYTILSIISLLYTSIINPIYSEYKDIYLEYMKKKEYIEKYNKKINLITKKAVEM